MTKQIKLKEALKLVSFTKDEDGKWQVEDVRGDISGYVGGDICGGVHGTVEGDIKSGEWQRVETPKQKLKNLIESGADKEKLLEAFNQLEDN